MDELIKRLRDNGKIEIAIYLNVAWTHFKSGLGKGRDTEVLFNNLRIDTVMDILEIEKLLIGDEYKRISNEVYEMRRERGMQ
jgi:hypothetical protein